jgi:hypothetical protein
MNFQNDLWAECRAQQNAMQPQQSDRGPHASVQTNQRLGKCLQYFLGDSRSEQSTPVGSIKTVSDYRSRTEHIEALGLPRTANNNEQHGISFRVELHIVETSFQLHFVFSKRRTNDKVGNAAVQAFVDAKSELLARLRHGLTPFDRHQKIPAAQILGGAQPNLRRRYESNRLRLLDYSPNPEIQKYGLCRVGSIGERIQIGESKNFLKRLNCSVSLSSKDVMKRGSFAA